ncbi:hypothetical protein Goshw_007266 [Gossypium schwendimanii]|uniref:Uncharacterized protein n=1 Tax=Gossypium schwendimanii TaxID=34291 RepID=A0A7J9NE33_GOSSC|nr:hypothetical protein [Gossypium schwendimanii]
MKNLDSIIQWVVSQFLVEKWFLLISHKACISSQLIKKI